MAVGSRSVYRRTAAAFSVLAQVGMEIQEDLDDDEQEHRPHRRSDSHDCQAANPDDDVQREHARLRLKHQMI